MHPMKIVDFFRFTVSRPSEENLFYLRDIDFHKSILEIQGHGVEHSLMALFDSEVIHNSQQVKKITEMINSEKFSFAYMPDIHGAVAEGQIERAIYIGCRAIVFHPYLQKIDGSLYKRVQELAVFASSKGLIVLICAAYGGVNIYNYSPLEVVAAVAEVVRTRIIIIHAGGLKVLDALLLAESFPQIHLDTSFSLLYWLKSPVEDMFAYAIRKLGADRWLFGSDAPFCVLSESIERHVSFLHRHNFQDAQIELVMGKNAENILRNGA